MFFLCEVWLADLSPTQGSEQAGITSAIGSNLGYLNSATPKVEISNSTNIIRIETFGAEISD
jgi:hypothetical protein